MGDRPDASTVIDTADSLVRQLRSTAQQDWSRRARTLDWTVRDVVDLSSMSAGSTHSIWPPEAPNGYPSTCGRTPPPAMTNGWTSSQPGVGAPS